ncbi:hypothetical protein [Murimonas intestini]|uniref:Uncharacterized protein n=1 Tax=Murimonas intestini TaxID=1337051 RepID=A0AB73SZ82_9FIRM|nr:hypothetical protein [Murimonas intestini]MCR1842839.1 hypothetical protein [Murimonas intestini]MCR1868196.1 hypothetical protein [Murimonas intestini]MCR1885312.1 hypothetical protein [Murimonas intestini]
MNTPTIFLICIVAIPVLVLIVLAIYNKINYKRQVSGKKALKKISDQKIASINKKEEPTNPDIELLQNEARLKSGQNLFS